jgi:hypothetical protein
VELSSPGDDEGIKDHHVGYFHVANVVFRFAVRCKNATIYKITDRRPSGKVLKINVKIGLTPGWSGVVDVDGPSGQTTTTPIKSIIAAS